MSPTHLWHPFANMAAVRGNEFTVTRGEGVWIWDEDGRRYLDASASLWYANVGHARAEIAEAVRRQLTTLEAYSAFGAFTTVPARELADRPSALAPMDDARVLLASGGADAIDTAAKLARQYWLAQGSPERTHLIAREHGYHGTHGFGTSLAGIEGNGAGFGRLVPDVSIVPHDSADALAAEIDALGADRVAAFFVEPVIGAGGVIPPPEGYVEAVAGVCADRGVLLVVDSVICGFGRLGTWFGIERWDVEPDMISFAKGVTSGYLPLGGLLVSNRVAAPFWEGEGAAFRHGATYAAHATVCAAAMANLDIMEAEGLVPRGRELEGALHAALEPLEGEPAVAEVRGGTGLLAAVELAPDLLASRPAAVGELATLARENGIIVRALDRAVAVSPPLTVEQEHLDLIGEALASAVQGLAARV